MSFIHRHSRLLLTAVCCLAIGAGASAIASAGASTVGSGKATARNAGVRVRGLRRLARRSVHADLVVATRKGFATVTFDRGKIDAVNGQQLTLTEGTKTASYRTITLTIPANARIRDNGQRATMSALQPGQRVTVLSGPQRTFVIARTPKSS